MINKVVFINFLLLTFQGISGFNGCHAAPPGYVHMQVTVLDTQRRPITGAFFNAFDTNHHPLNDPDEVAHASGQNGQVSYNIPASSIYYIRAYCQGYLSNETKVASAASNVSVTIMLKRAALPQYPITTIRAAIVDRHKRPIAGAFFDIFSATGHDLGNLTGSNDLAADTHGHVEKTVRAGGVVHVRVQAYGYDPVEKIVRSKPGVIPLVFVLKRNGGPLAVLQDVSP